MKKEPKFTIQEGLENLRRDLEAIIESQASTSIVLKARHEALIKAGFTEEQALEIVKARGMMP